MFVCFIICFIVCFFVYPTRQTFFDSNELLSTRFLPFLRMELAVITNFNHRKQRDRSNFEPFVLKLNTLNPKNAQAEFSKHDYAAESEGVV